MSGGAFVLGAIIGWAIKPSVDAEELALVSKIEALEDLDTKESQAEASKLKKKLTEAREACRLAAGGYAGIFGPTPYS